MEGTGGTQSGSAQNVNGSGGVVASSRGRSGYGDGGSGSVRVVGQSTVRGGGSQGRNSSNGGRSGNGGGNGGGASQQMNASGMHAQAQFQHPRIPSNHMTHQQTPVNYVHPHVHPQAHHPQAHNPHPYNPMNHIQPLVGGVFSPHAPYGPRTGDARFSLPNLGRNRPAYGPLRQLPGLPVPYGYPAIGNVNAGGMGFGNGGMVVNGWDSRWDGSGGDRGPGARPRVGRGRRRR
ncbi:hypothetical protein BPAE_0082g00140 [Botrytis paeoniae]|uniref:Uncharacterized protein n=1 Tax=Botrytis paeoniae TaxID=278948 RepID=A0A4Z1FLJ1_9HELO|nr:hypothetical protein BPAE_0082g00140 [Botrytis paeoniae]